LCANTYHTPINFKRLHKNKPQIFTLIFYGLRAFIIAGKRHIAPLVLCFFGYWYTFLSFLSVYLQKSPEEKKGLPAMLINVTFAGSFAFRKKLII
jgi:hypothetical protein